MKANIESKIIEFNIMNSHNDIILSGAISGYIKDSHINEDGVIVIDSFDLKDCSLAHSIKMPLTVSFNKSNTGT